MNSLSLLAFVVAQIFAFTCAGIPKENRHPEADNDEIDGCEDYKEFSSADRLEDFFQPNMVKCDWELKKGWYRFTGEAGSQMARSCMHTGATACSAIGSGWLVGSHPTEEEGIVSRGVCFRTRSSCCSSTTNIKVRNCGQYMVYFLEGTERCPYRYCSTKHPEKIEEPSTARPTTVTRPRTTKSLETTPPNEPAVSTAVHKSEIIVEHVITPETTSEPTSSHRHVAVTTTKTTQLTTPSEEPEIIVEPPGTTELPELVEPTATSKPEVVETVEPTQHPELVESTKNPKSVEPTENPESVEPVEPTEPVEPVEPTEPVEPVEPTEPVEPVEPIEPVEPVEPIEPVEPVEPTEPVEPIEPVEPESFSVECFSSHMVVKVNMALYIKKYHLERSFLHLSDPHCGVFHQGESDVTLVTPLDGCKTEHSFTRDRRIVFHNKVFGIPLGEEYHKKRQFITYELFHFSCTYNFV